MRIQITLLHHDHTADYPALLLCGPSVGLRAWTGADTANRLQVFGPGSRGVVEDVYPPARTYFLPYKNPPLREGKPINAAPWPDFAPIAVYDDPIANVNHIVPGNTPIGRLLRAKQNFSGRLVVGEDLMRIGVGKPLGRS